MKRALPFLAIAMGAALGVVLPERSARADAIDGDWCDQGGKALSIRGPRIVTPGGKELEGHYSRHAFDYVVPSGEPGAGGVVDMRLVNEQTVHLKPPGAAEPQVWKRCALKVS